MDFYSRRPAFIARALDRLADDLGFHPISIARPDLAPFAGIGEHVLVRHHPDGFDQILAIVPGDSPHDVAESAARAAATSNEHASLVTDKKLRIFLVGIGLGSASRNDRKRLLAETRLLNDKIVIRCFFLSLDRRRLYARSSPWSFAPGFEINPCDPDEDVFVDLVRRDRYLREKPVALTDADHRTALAKEQAFLMGLTGRRLAVRALIAANVLVWLALEMTGGSTWPAQLLRAGAKSNGLILAGQYWRFVTPVFLHAGWMHLALNSAGLLFLGETLERIYGTMAFVLVYFVAGIASVAASVAFGPQMMVGASGAVFGVAGALVVYGLRHRGRIPRRFGAMFGAGLLPLIALNILFGALVPGVDNWAHLGGLAAGVAVTLTLRPLADEPTERPWASPVRLAALVVLGLAAGSVAMAAHHFVRWADPFEADARWTLPRRVAGIIDIDVPASWIGQRHTSDAESWRAVAYDARLDARVVDASKNTDAVVMREFARLGQMGFRLVANDPNVLLALRFDLYSQGRVEFRLAGARGLRRQQTLLLLGGSLVSLGVEFPDPLAARLSPVLDRISASLPTPE